MLKEKILVCVVEHVGAPSKVVGESSRVSLRLPLLYLLKAIEFLSLVFVELGDDVREGPLQPRYNNVAESVDATSRRLDRPVEDLEVALQRRQFDQQIDRLLVIYLQLSHLLTCPMARGLSAAMFTTDKTKALSCTTYGEILYSNHLLTASG